MPAGHAMLVYIGFRSVFEESMREAVVVTSSRTALAKSFRGSFNMTRPDDLAAHCIQDVLRKTPKLDPAEIEDVVLGCGQPHGPQGHNVARVSAMLAGLPPPSPAQRSTAFALQDCRPLPWWRTRSSMKAWTQRSVAAWRASAWRSATAAPIRACRKPCPAFTW